MEKLYEVILKIRCMESEFIPSEWKAFASEEELEPVGLSSSGQKGSRIPVTVFEVA